MASTQGDKFHGRTALVTGAASGIGRAIAEALAARGASVVLADVDGSSAEKAAAEIAERTGGVTAALLDVTDPDAFTAVVDRIVGERGQLDLLVNNAGTAVGGEVQDLSIEHWDRVLDVNLKGTVNGVLAVYPGMVDRREGHIVNVASLAGFAPTPLLTPYATSKFGVMGLSLSLRAEAATHGIGVSVLCPGPVETSLLERTAPAGLPTAKSAPNPRDWVSKGLGRPCSAQSLACDLLRGIERNRAILIARRPRRARMAWYGMRLAPTLVLRVMEKRVREEQKRRNG
jgi:NAD(P)-dependent dehydrogenase (short-subunit alcohol dehydrogenase family)